MSVPLINVLHQPYEMTKHRPLRSDEQGTTMEHIHGKKDCVYKTINDHVKLAIEAFDGKCTDDIERIIGGLSSYDDAINAMNGEFPDSIRGYAERYASQDLDQTSADINRVGQVMTPGQVLFHGGVELHQVGDSFTTKRPYSTTLAPATAIMETHHRGKAYDAGCVVRGVECASCREWVKHQSLCLPEKVL